MPPPGLFLGPHFLATRQRGGWRGPATPSPGTQKGSTCTAGPREPRCVSRWDLGAGQKLGRKRCLGLSFVYLRIRAVNKAMPAACGGLSGVSQGVLGQARWPDFLCVDVVHTLTGTQQAHTHRPHISQHTHTDHTCTHTCTQAHTRAYTCAHHTHVHITHVYTYIHAQAHATLTHTLTSSLFSGVPAPNARLPLLLSSLHLDVSGPYVLLKPIEKQEEN